MMKKGMKQRSCYNFLGEKSLTTELKDLKLNSLNMKDFTERNLVSLLTFYRKKYSNFAIICINHPKYVIQSTSLPT